MLAPSRHVVWHAASSKGRTRNARIRLTTIRRNSISPISGFTQEGAPIKRSHEFLVIKIRQGEQAEKQICGPITGRDSSCYGHGNRNRSLVYFWRRARPAQHRADRYTKGAANFAEDRQRRRGCGRRPDEW